MYIKASIEILMHDTNVNVLCRDFRSIFKEYHLRRWLDNGCDKNHSMIYCEQFTENFTFGKYDTCGSCPYAYR